MSIVNYLFSFLFSFVSCFEYSTETGFEREPSLIYDIVMASYVYGEQYGIDPKLLLSISYVESRWNPNAGCERSRSSCGLYQQLPQYSSSYTDDCWDLRINCNVDYISEDFSNDLWLSTRVAARYLNALLEQESSVEMALERYHQGNVVNNLDFSYSNAIMRYRRQIFN